MQMQKGKFIFKSSFRFVFDPPSISNRIFASTKAIAKQSSQIGPECVFYNTINDEINTRIQHQKPVRNTDTDVRQKRHGKTTVLQTMVIMGYGPMIWVHNVVYLKNINN